MNFWKAVGPVLLALGFAQAAYAGTLASAPNYGGSIVASGGTVTCRIFNASGVTANIADSQIFTNAGTPVAPYFNSCAGGLGSHQSCEIDASITGNYAFACRASFTGTGVVLRGVSEIYDANGTLLDHLQMQ